MTALLDVVGDVVSSLGLELTLAILHSFLSRGRISSKSMTTARGPEFILPSLRCQIFSHHTEDMNWKMLTRRIEDGELLKEDHAQDDG